MKELNIMEATVLASPNPLTLICSKKEDEMCIRDSPYWKGKYFNKPAKKGEDKNA